MNPDSTATISAERVKSWLIVLVPAALAGSLLFISSQSPRGGVLFYLATFSVAAVYIAVWLIWGSKKTFLKARLGRDIAAGAVIGIGLLTTFLVGAWLVRNIPILVNPVQGLLDNALYGPIALTISVTVAAGIGEELFFRQVVLDSIPLSRRYGTIFSLALYCAVTATQGIPLLVFAALVIGAVSQLERRRTSSLVSPITLHLVWSVSMLLILPLAL